MAHLDQEQPPSSKHKPWSILASQGFIHKIDLIIPNEVLDIVEQKLVTDRPAPEFKRVIMRLEDILTGDFFTEYIKLRDTTMLSEGRMSIDNVISLKDGKLSLFIDKETYERAGLVGQPHGVKGKRGLKPRWIVEFDLQSSSMVHGKKGFDRLIYACKNVFSHTITWLFHCSSPAPQPDPLAQHYPIAFGVNPEISRSIPTSMPALRPNPAAAGFGSRDEFEEFTVDIYEWLSLVRLGSPRLDPTDNIDPFLSRYETPGELEDKEETNLSRISWTGFLTPAWAKATLVDLIATVPSRTWLSFSSTTFSTGIGGGNSDFTFLRPPDATGEFVTWEIKPHE